MKNQSGIRFGQVTLAGLSCIAALAGLALADPPACHVLAAANTLDSQQLMPNAKSVITQQHQVSRVIDVHNPLTGQVDTYRQVAILPTTANDDQSQLRAIDHNGFPEFFAPHFKGFRPASADQAELPSQTVNNQTRHQSTAEIHYVPVDGSQSSRQPVKIKFNLRLPGESQGVAIASSAHLGDQVALPQLPEGLHYVFSDQLPQTVYVDQASNYSLLVEPTDNLPANIQACRVIDLSTPTGKHKVIRQWVKVSRCLKLAAGQLKVGPWQTAGVSFPEYQLPEYLGYTDYFRHRINAERLTAGMLKNRGKLLPKCFVGYFRLAKEKVELQTLTRQIILKIPGKTPTLVNQTVKAGRNHYSPNLIGQWLFENSFPEYRVPQIAGLLADRQSVPALVPTKAMIQQPIISEMVQYRPAAVEKREEKRALSRHIVLKLPKGGKQLATQTVTGHRLIKTDPVTGKVIIGKWQFDAVFPGFTCPTIKGYRALNPIIPSLTPTGQLFKQKMPTIIVEYKPDIQMTSETKTLQRQIIFKMAGKADKVVTQQAGLIRTVTENLATHHKKFSPWHVVQPFPALAIRPITGYQPTINKIPALSPHVEQIEKGVVLIIVKYHPISNQASADVKNGIGSVNKPKLHQQPQTMIPSSISEGLDSRIDKEPAHPANSLTAPTQISSAQAKKPKEEIHQASAPQSAVDRPTFVNEASSNQGQAGRTNSDQVRSKSRLVVSASLSTGDQLMMADDPSPAVRKPIIPSNPKRSQFKSEIATVVASRTKKGPNPRGNAPATFVHSVADHPDQNAIRGADQPVQAPDNHLSWTHSPEVTGTSAFQLDNPIYPKNSFNQEAGIKKLKQTNKEALSSNKELTTSNDHSDLVNLIHQDQRSSNQALTPFGQTTTRSNQPEIVKLKPVKKRKASIKTNFVPGSATNSALPATGNGMSHLSIISGIVIGFFNWWLRNLTGPNKGGKVKLPSQKRSEQGAHVD